MADSFVDVAGVTDIPPGEFSCVKVGDQGVVVANVKGEFYAVENLCSHALQTFDEGRLRGPRLMCPLHGATFDVRDGAAKGAPATSPIQSFPLRISGDRIEVDVSEEA